jgi:hypothetical protein
MLAIVIRTLRSFALVVDQVSSRVLGRDGSLRNVREQLDDRRRMLEQIDVLGRRVAAVTRRDLPRAA